MFSQLLQLIIKDSLNRLNEKIYEFNTSVTVRVSLIGAFLQQLNLSPNSYECPWCRISNLRQSFLTNLFQYLENDQCE
jgi:hypothetical protein